MIWYWDWMSSMTKRWDEPPPPPHSLSFCLSPCPAAYRWGQQRQGSKGKLREIFQMKFHMHEYVRVDKSFLIWSLLDELSAPWDAFLRGCLKFSRHALSCRGGCLNPLFLSHESTEPLSALWMSGTMAVAMVMPHCNILLQLSCPLMLAAASKLQKKKKMTEEGGEEREETKSSGGLRQDPPEC